MVSKPSMARVLIIAGSDSGGGAGIQADIKTVTALGAYAATAITAVTVQNTLGVSAIHAVPVATVVAQISAVLGDIGADVIKTGMLASGEIIDTVFSLLRREAAAIPLIVDPVMVAKGGASLIDKDAILAMKAPLPAARDADHAEPAGSRSADSVARSRRCKRCARRCPALLRSRAKRRAAQRRPFAWRSRRRHLCRPRRHAGVERYTHRNASHARHRLYACVGHRNGVGSRSERHRFDRPRAGALFAARWKRRPVSVAATGRSITRYTVRPTLHGGMTMELKLWQVDAFADKPFEGNPAAVVPLDRVADRRGDAGDRRREQSLRNRLLRADRARAPATITCAGSRRPSRSRSAATPRSPALTSSSRICSRNCRASNSRPRAAC